MSVLLMGLVAPIADGQSTEPVQRSTSIPPPRRFNVGDPVFQSRLATPSSPDSRPQQPPPQSTTPASSRERTDSLPETPLPTALPLEARSSNKPDAGTPKPLLPIDTTLIPGRTIEPIDLPGALKLAGVRDLDIAIARQQLGQAVADLEKARALWLPSLFLGPTWYRADGQIQTVTGQVQNVNRGSLYIGGMAATANGFAAPSPGTGYPPVNGLASVLRFSDAIFEPLAARRIVAANQAGIQTSTNNAMLEVAEAYLDLQQASGRVAIAREAGANALALSEITGSYARAGQGLEADHRRALAELKHRRKEVQLASGQLLVASANVVRLLVLDPRIVIAPIEPAETIIRLIPDDVPLDDLVATGLAATTRTGRSARAGAGRIAKVEAGQAASLHPKSGFHHRGGRIWRR